MTKTKRITNEQREVIVRKAVADRDAALREQEAQPAPKCEGCNGHGMVGNISDADVCPFCNGSGIEAAQPAAQEPNTVVLRERTVGEKAAYLQGVEFGKKLKEHP